MNFFVKPWVFTDNAFKDVFWESLLEIYMNLAQYHNFPFSFNEYINLPLFMMDKLNKIQKEISEKRKKTYQTLNTKQTRV